MVHTIDTVSSALEDIRDRYVMSNPDGQALLVAARVVANEFERIERAWNELARYIEMLKQQDRPGRDILEQIQHVMAKLERV